jgi:glycosyltransferase involved in cell wall biosynthesis
MPLRVLHIGKYFPPEPGGMERFLDELTREQARQGLRVSVLAHDRHRGGSEVSAERRIHRCRSHGQLLFAPLAPAWPMRLAGILAEDRPDLLHLHLPNASAFAALLLPAARRLPWVVHWHADVPHDAAHAGLRLAYPVYAAFERRLLARGAAIITTSSAYLQASRPLAAHRSRCHVVPLGLGEAPTAAAGWRWPGPGLRVLAVGRLSYYKGFDRLIEALAEVEDASLLLAGSGDQDGALRALIAARGLEERVQLRPGLDDAGIEAAYRSCDLLCLPSIDRAEAFGLVLLEAMRAGKPVVASRLYGSGMSEVVLDQLTGLQVETGSVSALATALRQLRDDPALRLRLGAAGKLRFEREFRLTPVAEAISRIYRSVASR